MNIERLIREIERAEEEEKRLEGIYRYTDSDEDRKNWRMGLGELIGLRKALRILSK